MSTQLKLVILTAPNCRYCVAMKKANVVKRFMENADNVTLEEHSLPENWGDEEDATAAEKLKILAARTESERSAVRLAKRLDVKGVPFVAFMDERLTEIYAEAPGAVNLTQLADLHQEAIENSEEEG